MKRNAELHNATQAGIPAVASTIGKLLFRINSALMSLWRPINDVPIAPAHLSVMHDN